MVEDLFPGLAHHLLLRVPALGRNDWEAVGCGEDSPMAGVGLVPWGHPQHLHIGAEMHT